MIARRGALAVTCGMLLASACGGSGAAPPANLAYSTNPARYVVGVAIAPNVPTSSGGPITSYVASPALPPGLTLDATSGVISGTPSVAVIARAHVVTGTNGAGSATVELSITVDAPPVDPPVIGGFRASPSAIAPGGASLLTWEVLGADTVRIEPIPGLLSGTGILVQPTADTTFVLVARNGGGESRSSVLLPVEIPALPPSDPANFATFTVAGGGIALRWDLQALATGYLLERMSNVQPGFVAIAQLAGGEVAHFDGSTTANELYTYRLRAVNGAGSSAGVVASSLAAPPPPEGPSLGVSPSSVILAPGGTHSFSASGTATWQVLEGAIGGAIAADGSYRAPAGRGVWHVVANGGGVAAVATVTVP